MTSLLGRGVPRPARRLARRTVDAAREGLLRRLHGPDRHVRVVVPTARPAALEDSVAALRLTAPRELRVPRKLQEVGLGGYEPESMACFLAALRVAQAGAVFDVGANIAIYAAVAASVTERDVRAFEPMPQLAAVAESFALDNGLNFVTERLALGSTEGTASFYLADNSDTTNSLNPTFRQSSEQITVNVSTIDAYAARTGLVPAVLKIDTESTEPDVLLGGTITLEQHRPWILCEVLAGVGVEDRLMQVLKPLDYTWYHLAGPPPYPERISIQADRTHEKLMWLFAPRPLNDDFWSALQQSSAALTMCGPPP